MFTRKDPLVSVIIPSYNGMPYLKEAIESVLTQTYPNVELIVLDDGSTDNTKEFLEHYKGKFYYETHENMGQAETLNKGWRMCQGELIGYLSADDILMPEAISTSVKCFIGNPDIVLTYADNNLIDSKSRVIKKLCVAECDRYSLHLDATTPIAVASFFLRSAFEKIGGWNNNYRQIGDYEYQLRLINIGNFKKINKILGLHRVHNKSASYGKMSYERADEYKKVMLEILSKTKDPKLLLLKKQILSKCLMMSGRTHWRSGRYKTGLLYFSTSIFYYPKAIFKRGTYKIVLNALFSKFFYRFIKKVQQ